MRDWTDTCDDIAYAVFSNLADEHGGPEQAEKIMRKVMRMGASFTELDIQAWSRRFADEEWNQYQADQERAADRFVSANTTI